MLDNELLERLKKANCFLIIFDEGEELGSSIHCEGNGGDLLVTISNAIREEPVMIDILQTAIDVAQTFETTEED